MVAWCRVNPSIGALPEDKDENLDKAKETTLFGGCFLERATKRIEEQKALAKVAGAGNGPPHKCQQTQDLHDLHRFLEKGAPARYGGKELQAPEAVPPSSYRGERSRRANSQPNSCEGTIDSCTHNFTIFNECFFPYPWCIAPSNSGSPPSVSQQLAPNYI